MPIKLFIILSLIVLSSCTSSTKTLDQSQLKEPSKIILSKIMPSAETSKETSATSNEMMVPVGLIFAKTVFEGIVKTSYVELALVDQAEPKKEYQLIIGDKERQTSFPWEVQTVMPGYFFIELPDGQYQIHSITIPVGTTKAKESMDVVFEVKAGQATYLGTLFINGVKEKVRMGGVPVIQPSFEYVVSLNNDEQEAYKQFYNRYPDFQEPVKTKLMQVNLSTNGTPGSS